MDFWKFLIFLIFKTQLRLINADDDVKLVTQTIYGFLDFTTTIANTVMIFSPQSSAALYLSSTMKTTTEVIKTKPLDNEINSIVFSSLDPTRISSTTVSSVTKEKDSQLHLTAQVENKTVVVMSQTQTISKMKHETTLNEVKPIKNELYDPEYNLLSRQPPQFIEETYRLINLKSINSNSNKNLRTTILVTAEKTPSTTIPNNSVTTTAPTLKTSTSTTIKLSSSIIRSAKNKKNKLRPSNIIPHVLKTAAPLSTSNSRIQNSNNKLSRNFNGTLSTSLLPNRKINKKPSNRKNELTTITSITEEIVTARSISTRNKPKRKSKSKNLSSRSKPKFTSTTTSSNLSELTIRRNFRPKTNQQTHNEAELNNNLHITKLNRAPGRWQYKTTPKPRVTIRKSTPIDVLGLTNVSTSSTNFVSDASLNDNINNNFVLMNQSDLESSGSQNGAIVNHLEDSDEEKQKFFTETINVEISTPADFKDTYYEIATIKKPFVFQVGILKKTRYITVTSTIEKYITSEVTSEFRNDDEPLTENILVTTSKPEAGLLIGSISTLAPIFMENKSSTPTLDTVTESFSIVNKKLKTQVLPIVYAAVNETSYHTMVQTIDATSLITITRTLLPQLHSNNVLNGFKDFVDNLDEAGSEINLDLEFGDESNHENVSTNIHHQNEFEGLDNFKSKINPSILITIATPSMSETASSILTPSMSLSTIITNTRPVIKLKTLWESHIIPVTNGQLTSFRTLSKSIGVVEKTEYAIDSTTVPVPPQILPPSSINPFLYPLQQHQYQTITSSIVQQAIVTHTESKILKLTFGAKTAYTTLYSTQVVPTLQTMYVTTSIPIQPSANPFPGFFPQAYNPYAYLG